MLKPSDFNNAVPQFRNGNYASNPINPQYVEEPSSTDYNRGTEPLQTLPAQWWNWFMNKFTSRFNKVNIYVKNLFNELAQLLSLVNVTPDGTEGNVTDGQLKNAFKELYPDYINTKLALESTYVKKTQKVNNHALSGDVTVTKSDVGLGNVPNVSTNDQTPTYTEASTLTALSSGEKLSIAFGKLAEAVSSLISHIANVSNPHSVTKAQVQLGNVVNTGDSATPVKNGTTKFTTGGAYTELNKKANVSTLATAFSASTNYAVGDYVIYNGNLYRCTVAHSAGDWNASHFTAVTVGNELETLKQTKTENIVIDLANYTTAQYVAIADVTSWVDDQYTFGGPACFVGTINTIRPYADGNNQYNVLSAILMVSGSTIDRKVLTIKYLSYDHNTSSTTFKPCIFFTNNKYYLGFYIYPVDRMYLRLNGIFLKTLNSFLSFSNATIYIEGESIKETSSVTQNSRDVLTSGGAYNFFGGNTNSKTWLTKLFSRTIGNSWTDSLDVETSGTQYGVAYGNGVWVIASQRGTFWSENLTNWTAITGVGSGSNSIEFKDGIFVLGTSHTGVWWSENGKSYTLATGISNSITVYIRHVGELWFASSGNNAWWSENGKSWTTCVGTANGISLSVLDYGDGKYFASKNNNTNLMTSNDGKSWSAVTSSYFNKRVTAIKYAKGVWFVGTDRDTYDKNLFTSKDGGTTWNVENIVNDSNMYVMNIQITGNIAIITYYDPNRSATTFIVTFGLTKENSCIIKSTKIEAFALNSLVKIYGTYFAVTLPGGLMRSTDLLIWEDTFVKAGSFGLNKLLFADNKLLYTSLAGGAQFSEIDLNAI